MKKASRQPSLEKAKQSALFFFQKQKRFKEVQAQFTKLKEQFYSDMELYFADTEDKELVIDCSDDSINGENLIVRKVQKSSIEFFADRLEKALGKELGSKVVSRRYEISDMAALTAYLKECGADPKIFKSFIYCSKREVDTKELDRLEAIGEIDASQLKGCYKVSSQNPYYTVSVKRGQGGYD